MNLFSYGQSMKSSFLALFLLFFFLSNGKTLTIVEESYVIPSSHQQHKQILEDHSTQSRYLIVKNDYVTFNFSVDDGLGIVDIKNTMSLAKMYSFMVKNDSNVFSTKRPSFWNLFFVEQTGREVLIDSNTIPSENLNYTQIAADKMQFMWKDVVVDSHGLNTVTVVVEMTLSQVSGLAHFTASIADFKPPGSVVNSCLWGFDFVVLNNIGASDGKYKDDYLFHPYGFGEELKAPHAKKNFNSNNMYPCTQASMQFGSFYRKVVQKSTPKTKTMPVSFVTESKGLYYGIHDPNAYAKKLVYMSDPLSLVPLLSMYTTHIPSDTCNTETFEPYAVPYPVVIGVYMGEWYDAAQIYREWAVVQRNANWLKYGTYSNRTFTPPWLSQTDMWINTGWEPGALNTTNGDPDLVLDRVSKFFKLFHINQLNIHWYNWHKIPFDTNYPQFLPPKDNFEKVVQELHLLGNIKIFPYINGRIFDYNSELWKVESEKNSAHVSAPRLFPKTLQNTIETYGSQQAFAVMCPYTDYWKNLIANIISTLIGSYRVDGVYVDQIANEPPTTCFSKDHGHPIGGGSYWPEGYHSTVRIARSQVPAKKIALITESNAEVYMQEYDGFLCLKAMSRCSSVPAFPSVYGGYYLGFGRVFTIADLLEDNRMPVKLLNMFVQGLQIGWFSLGGNFDVLRLIEPEYENVVRFIQNLIDYRQVAQYYTLHGRLLRPLPFESDANTVNVDGCKFPPVQLSVWGLNTKTLGIVFGNSGTVASKIVFTLVFSDYFEHYKPGTNVILHRMNPDGTPEKIGEFKDLLIFSTKLIPLDIVVLQASYV